MYAPFRARRQAKGARHVKIEVALFARREESVENIYMEVHILAGDMGKQRLEEYETSHEALLATALNN